MKTKPTAYNIEDTPCYPCRWKIVPVGNWKQNNSPTEYFETREAAQAEIDRRLS